MGRYIRHKPIAPQWRHNFLLQRRYYEDRGHFLESRQGLTDAWRLRLLFYVHVLESLLWFAFKVAQLFEIVDS